MFVHGMGFPTIDILQTSSHMIDYFPHRLNHPQEELAKFGYRSAAA
jgi:hypothetical protein